MPLDGIASHQAFTEFGHEKQASEMLAITPEAEGRAPFLEAGAEILRAIDRVQQRYVAAAWRVRGIEAFLADKGQIRDAGNQKILHQALDIDIRCGDGAAIRLPGDIAAA